MTFSFIRRLLKQSSDAVQREKQLKEAERLYLNLRQVVAKQPGAEVQSELTKTQRALVIRKNKMKVWQRCFTVIFKDDFLNLLLVFGG